MPTGWDSILTVISFDDCYTDGLEMLLLVCLDSSTPTSMNTVPCHMGLIKVAILTLSVNWEG